TLSQAGMVRRWRRLKTPRWRANALVNGAGAVATGVVTLVIASSKWAVGEKLHLGHLSIPTGSWMVVLLVPALVGMFHVIHRHYRQMADELTMEDYVPAQPPHAT